MNELTDYELKILMLVLTWYIEVIKENLKAIPNDENLKEYIKFLQGIFAKLKKIKKEVKRDEDNT